MCLVEPDPVLGEVMAVNPSLLSQQGCWFATELTQAPSGGRLHWHNHISELSYPASWESQAKDQVLKQRWAVLSRNTCWIVSVNWSPGLHLAFSYFWACLESFKCQDVIAFRIPFHSGFHVTMTFQLCYSVYIDRESTLGGADSWKVTLSLNIEPRTIANTIKQEGEYKRQLK